MAKNQFTATVSTRQLIYQPGGEPAEFTVTVINQSHDLASFEVELQAAGSETQALGEWYRVSPEVSTKLPAGGQTSFTVSLVRSPKPAWVGEMDLTVLVSSIDLSNRKDRTLLRLTLQKGFEAIPLQVELPAKQFERDPGDRLDIRVDVTNPGYAPTDATLEFTGLDDSWLIEGTTRSIASLLGKSRQKVWFACQPPPDNTAVSDRYPFTVVATQTNGPTSSVTGYLEIGKIGTIVFSCLPNHCRIPLQRPWFSWRRSSPVTVDLRVDNQSNSLQLIGVEITGKDYVRCQPDLSSDQVTVNPSDSESLELTVNPRRHWLGRVRPLKLLINAKGKDRNVNIDNESQSLTIELYPVIHLWLFLAGGLLALLPLWWFSWLNPDSPLFGHQGPVQSIQFNGRGRGLISSSSSIQKQARNDFGLHRLISALLKLEDETIIEWSVPGFFNPLSNHEVQPIVVPSSTSSQLIVRSLSSLADDQLEFLEDAKISAQFVSNQRIWQLVKGSLSANQRQPFPTGGIFLKDPIRLIDDKGQPIAFHSQFRFRITDSGGLPSTAQKGADGMVFVVASRPTPQLESNQGGGIGYQGIRKSLGIEIDTYRNSIFNDVTDNHIGVNLNGDMRSALQVPVAGNFKNGQVWSVWIDYQAPTLEVRITQETQRPEQATILETLDIYQVLNQPTAYFGFTSGTGGEYSTHEILDWRVAVDDATAIAQVPSVNVIRYRPLENTWVVGGTPSGQILLQDLLNPSRPATVMETNGAIQALDYTRDSQMLLSAHDDGPTAGRVMQWQVAANNPTTLIKSREWRFDFEVESLALVGNQQNFFVVAGRNNQLRVCDRPPERQFDQQSQTCQAIPYQAPSLQGNPDVSPPAQYIVSLAVAAEQPSLLVTADTSGQITTWNMSDNQLAQCLVTPETCRRLQNPHTVSSQDGTAIRSVALSENGCYLVSGGDEGKVRLWSLDAQGQFTDEFPGKNVFPVWRSPVVALRNVLKHLWVKVQKLLGNDVDSRWLQINSVDIKLDNQVLYVAAGGNDTQVRVNRINVKDSSCSAQL